MQYLVSVIDDMTGLATPDEMACSRKAEVRPLL
jgi:hypothetical protein